MKTSDNRIYAHVKSNILNGAYAPGSRVNLRALGELFEVSRLPIRDALNHLNGEGLVQQGPSGGYFVTPLTETDIRETYEMRGIMEGHLAAQAAMNFSEPQISVLEKNIQKQEKEKGNIENYSGLNRSFHEAFFQATANSKFIQMLRQLRDYQDRFDQINWKTNGQPFIAVTFQQHLEILDAVKRKNPELATRMVKLHMNTGVEFLIPALKKRELLED